MGKKYNPYFGVDVQYLDFSCFSNNDIKMKQFVDNFNVGEFREWVKWNEKKHNEFKKIDNFKLELDDKIKERNKETALIKNKIEIKLGYFANKEFTLQQIWDEYDYAQTYSTHNKLNENISYKLESDELELDKLEFDELLDELELDKNN